MNHPRQSQAAPVSDPGKTHYRKAFKSPYLGSADVVDPIVVTIKVVKLEEDLTKKTKDCFNTAHFVERFIRPGEPLKPMILNITNCELLYALSGSRYIEDWAGLRVMIKTDPTVKMKNEVVGGLRLAKAPSLCADMSDERQEAWREAARTGGTEAASEFFRSMSREEREFSKGGLRKEVWDMAEQWDAQQPAADALPEDDTDRPAEEAQPAEASQEGQP